MSFGDYSSFDYTSKNCRPNAARFTDETDAVMNNRSTYISKHKRQQSEIIEKILLGNIQQQIETDKMEIQICNKKMKKMENLIVNFQNEQESLHYVIQQLNQKINMLDSNIKQNTHQKDYQLRSDVNDKLRLQQDFTVQINQATVQKTNVLFNRLYQQIHDYIGVKDEKQIEDIKAQIKQLLSSNYEYFET
jgi:predicted RNase H-like nuclease (RuvC/YqgF family)